MKTESELREMAWKVLQEIDDAPGGVDEMHAVFMALQQVQNEAVECVLPSEAELMAFVKDPAWPHPTWTGPEVRAVYGWLRSQIEGEK